ncbi:hypothetical protein QMT40_001790 [Parvibaculaceae bacterium PLY_AMNH_Bact1]|nr:hypothetical protein QMT40_001790 [Parvibaculaceae bacterium PLY_AMNH_Bact1]
MHKLDDKTLITKTLLERFDLEADGAYSAVMQKNDGSFLEHTIGPAITAARMLFSQDLLSFLHRELAYDGAWVIVHTHPKPPTVPEVECEHGRFGIIFLDQDGDPQFTVEWEENDGEMLDFADVLLAGMETWGGLCYTALMQQRHFMKDVLDPTEGQTFQKARGEKAPSAIH